MRIQFRNTACSVIIIFVSSISQKRTISHGFENALVHRLMTRGQTRHGLVSCTRPRDVPNTAWYRIQNPRAVNTVSAILTALVGIFYSWPLAAWFLSWKHMLTEPLFSVLRMNRGRLVVCLEDSLYIHNIRDMKVAPYLCEDFHRVPHPWHFGVDPDPDPRIHASD
jgi:hypothetical protein